MLIVESISLYTSGKLWGFSWKLLLLLEWYRQYCCKRSLIWQNILEVFRRIYLNINFWILLWMLTSLLIWNLNTTVSTTLKYCYKKALNKKLKLMEGAMTYFPKKLLGHETFRSRFSWATKFFFKKFVKFSSPPSYILNVRSLSTKC